MDVIITGLIKSGAYTDDVKKLVFVKLLGSLPNGENEIEYSKLLQFALSLLKGESKLEKEFGETLLKSISEKSVSVFNKFVTLNLTEYVLKEPINASTIQSLDIILKLSSNTLQMNEVTAMETIIHTDSLPNEVQVEVAKFLINYPAFMFQIRANFSEIFITWLAQTHPQSPTFDIDVKNIMKLLILSWEGFSQNQVLQSLAKFFSLIATNLETSPSFHAVFENIPVLFLGLAVNHVTNNPSIPDAVIETLIGRMIQWPLSTKLATWILGLLQGLINSKKFTVLTRITFSGVFNVFKQLFIPTLRKGALMLLEFMLLGYQHAPDAFHKLKMRNLSNWEKMVTSSPKVDAIDQSAKKSKKDDSDGITFTKRNTIIALYALLNDDPDAPKLLSEIRSETDPKIYQDWDPLQGIANLLYILMYLHCGHPETPPLDIIIRQELSERAWTKDKCKYFLTTRDFVVSELPYDLRGKSSIGKAGLKNLGNTCYMNSFLQSLFMTDQLRESVTGLPLTETKHGMLQELERTFAFLLLTQRAAIAPESFKRVLPAWYRSGLQQDSSEFGKYVLDVLESESKNTKLNGFIDQLFGGQLTNFIKCKTCNNLSSRKEDFVELSLAFPDQIKEGTDFSIDDMIKFFITPEKLEGKNQYFCEKCNAHSDAEKFAHISKVPTHLILTLKRFAYDPVTQSRNKIMTEVNYPLSIKIPEEETSSENSYIVREREYILYAVVMHSGQSIDHGHYYTYARHSELALKDDSSQWYLFNDSNVALSSFESFSKITKTFRNDVAYILFYRLKENSNAIVEKVSESIPSQLSNEVIADNKNFLLEREKHELQKERQVSSAPTRNYYPKRDDYDDGGSFNPFGNGFGGGRYVF